uniref:Clathrin binding box of aftiphilin containing 1 n=1 Tax=Balaenoptera musculus TaxID=9771 RepID=A0A8C0HZW1_BALMU
PEPLRAAAERRGGDGCQQASPFPPRTELRRRGGGAWRCHAPRGAGALTPGRQTTEAGQSRVVAGQLSGAGRGDPRQPAAPAGGGGDVAESFELPERPTEPQPPRTISAQEERGSRQSHQGGPGVTGTSAITPSEPIVNYEKIFRFAFQEVPVPQATEDVSTFDHFLETSNEEKLGLESVHKLCSESRKLWRALQNTRTVMTSRCLWSESRCRENFLLVLGIDAAQKSLSEGPGRTLGDPGLHEPEELGFRLHRCTALIQTKLSGTPGGRQGRLITYSLFLKTPVRGNGQYITIPRKKKIFTPRNLKMTLFNSDVC